MTTEVKEELRITELELAKIQESNEALKEIQSKVFENYQTEFELKQLYTQLETRRLAVDKDNEKVLTERNSLFKQLSEKYGDVQIDFNTGIIKN